MPRFDGSLARTLDFGDLTTTTFGPGRTLPRPVLPRRVLTVELRLAAQPEPLRGTGKYKVLEHRRHQAQIKARRLLDLL